MPVASLAGRPLRAVLVLFALFGLAACEPAAPPPSDETTSSAAGETERLMAFFQRVHDEDVARSPMFQSRLGIKTDYDKWDPLTEERADENLALALARLEELRGFDVAVLEPQALVSYRIFEKLTQNRIENDRWRHHFYAVDQMNGMHQQIPSFLINIHRVGSKSDAEAYVARLRGVRTLVDELIARMRLREEKGVLPPAFVFPLIVEAAGNVISGAPFEEGPDSTLLADFRKKVAALDIEAADKEVLLADASAALVGQVGPAYRDLIAEMERQATLATTDDGAWKLPDGGAFYQARLETYTTTDMTADEIHEMGLAHVARIHDEMRAIMERVGFEGDLAAFFEFMRTDPRFFYPNTEEGKTRYVADATALIDTIRTRLPEVFGRLPQADMIVKRVEPFRERSAGKAFYQSPALDGSRPGTYYANLYDTADMPIYQMEALAYHEGIPGHHMQRAISQELEGVPMFQRLAGFTAYTEGWGLYSELLPKEMGFYEDPYSDFGRLSMELWRAVRLVVDTGIHARRWSREDAIAYHRENTPASIGDIEKAVERYIVMPGQATAYLIGKEKILELREAAKAELGAAFDIRAFHDAVLEDGPLPLDMLEDKIARFVEARRPAG